MSSFELRYLFRAVGAIHCDVDVWGADISVWQVAAEHAQLCQQRNVWAGERQVRVQVAHFCYMHRVTNSTEQSPFGLAKTAHSSRS